MNTLRSVIVIAVFLATPLPLHCQTVSNTLPAAFTNSITLPNSNLTQPQANDTCLTPEIHPIQKTHPTASDFSAEDLEYLKQRGIRPEDLVPVTNEPPQQAETPQAVVWLDNFMGMTNAVIPADSITVKKDSLQFRFGDQEFNVSGNFMVMFNTPRKHKNPYFGFGSPDKAKLVILENVGGQTYPVTDATIWEKSSDFIDIEGLGKEWIRSGPYTIQN